MNRLLTVGCRRQWTSNSPSALFALGRPPRLELSSQSSILPLSCRRRCFASSPITRTTHYEQLDIPKSATKQQIKISYYKLSKLYHPDLANIERKEAGAKYHAVRQAYEVLSDDRKRREYDTSLAAVARRNGLHSQSVYGYEYEDDLLRAGQHRGATHAWDRYHRSHAQHRTQSTHDFPFAPRSPPPHSPHSDGTRRRHGWSPSADERRRRSESIDSHEHRVRSESGLVRFLQVFGIFWFLSLLGGWSVNAG